MGSVRSWMLDRRDEDALMYVAVGGGGVVVGGSSGGGGGGNGGAGRKSINSNETVTATDKASWRQGGL